MEILLGFQAFCAIVLTAICAFFWMCGGRSIPELRIVCLDFNGWKYASRFWGRFFAPIMFGTGVNLLALWVSHWHWYLILYIPSMVGVSHLGHHNYERRLIKAVAWSIPSLLLCFASGHWTLLIIQLFISVMAQIGLGILNPIKAPQEELLIYFLMSVTMSFMAL